MRLNPSDLPDWSDAAAYAVLLGADQSAFAWEWTRRSAAYRAAWSAFLHNPETAPNPRSFGLERFENPLLRVPSARPIWSSSAMGNVIKAHVAYTGAPIDERIDLRRLANLVTICIDRTGDEHLLLSDGRHFLRVDVTAGTLIGCPASLTILLSGLARLDKPILAIDRLVRLVRKGRFDTGASDICERQKRWILELRTADALMTGCNQQQIARTLFGSAISAKGWRTESASYRRRVQRLAEHVRQTLRAPLDRWSGSRGHNAPMPAGRPASPSPVCGVWT